MIQINVAKDFSKAPGGRFKSESKHSAEEFRELLLRSIESAMKKNVECVVDLDGTYGYAASFLDEAFLGLTKDQRECLKFISNEEPDLIDEIKSNWELEIQS